MKELTQSEYQAGGVQTLGFEEDERGRVRAHLQRKNLNGGRKEDLSAGNAHCPEGNAQMSPTGRLRVGLSLALWTIDLSSR